VLIGGHSVKNSELKSGSTRLCRHGAYFDRRP
jgi:hypothetical protein